MRLFPLVLGLLFFLAGCGGERVAPVSGKVTLDGKPLADAMVSFTPVSEEANPGPGSQGKTDENGLYTLTLITKDVRGAIVGKHKVSISKSEAGEIDSAKPTPRVDLVPAEFNSNSKLTFDVTASGSKNADFDLKSTPPMPK